MKHFEKDTIAELDYVFDWSDWIGNDTIDTIELSVTPVDTELVVDSSINLGNGQVLVWLSGGLIGKSYTVSCKITTAGTRVDVRSAIFTIAPQ